MHSLRVWNWLVLGSVVGMAHSAALPMPAITPAPRPADVHVSPLQHRQDPDALEVLEVLITALPLSLRQIAATNIPAVSSILWSQFLDDKRPQWFEELPYDIQSYFIQEFGPATAAPPASGTLPTGVTASVTELPTETSALQSSKLSGSEQATTSTLAISTPAASSGLSTKLPSLASSSGPTTLISTSVPSTTSLSTPKPLVSSSSATSTTTADPVAPESSDSDLTRREKIGIGVGVPLAFLAIAGLLFGCCFLLRRKRRRAIEGSQPPSSPGFIPRFSFQDRGLSRERLEHRAPLNPSYHQSRFAEDTNWEDEGYDPGTAYQGYTLPPAGAPTPSQAKAIAREGPSDSYQGSSAPVATPPMAMQDDHRPILAPALYHSHSSNRARGRRTSYTSLHSVAEVTEPDSDMYIESPILGRHNLPPIDTGSGLSSKVIGATPAAARSIKRKPVPTSPAADLASRTLLRPPLARNPDDHSGSSSSGLVLSSLSSYNSSSSGSGWYQTSHNNSSSKEDDEDYASQHIQPQYSHTQQPQVQTTANPFTNTSGGYAYLEDYGPEYSHDGYNNNNYRDGDDGAYGGHVSLDRYGDPGSPQAGNNSSKSGKTDWPLRNMMSGGSGRGRARTTSPIWDRVYERM
ncbi:hypothetical protein GMOD_00003346 [Pyrenophora seminiperda CCB06]|uniref:Uncharacterized protein n=1 Tax=Pyrenophora seminiperda CCB06 TaxID=1302712 RepID=A0A3M7MIY6_9PLEO|nr:hypothetical protein GMOD_00003346 [Pyrenophora seminiperda CCB06]